MSHKGICPVWGQPNLSITSLPMYSTGTQYGVVIWLGSVTCHIHGLPTPYFVTLFGEAFRRLKG